MYLSQVSKPVLNNAELSASYYNHKFKDTLGNDGDMGTQGLNVNITVKFKVA